MSTPAVKGVIKGGAEYFLCYIGHSTVDAKMSLTSTLESPVLERQIHAVGSAAVEQVALPRRNPRLAGYVAWVTAWIENPDNEDFGDTPSSTLTLDDLVNIFRRNTLNELQGSKMVHAVQAAQRLIKQQETKMYSPYPPTHEATNPYSQAYEPLTVCNCSGLYPLDGSESLETALARCDCEAIQKMVANMEATIDREHEWGGHSMLSSKRLKEAVTELIFLNVDVQSYPTTCSGDGLALREIKAPDRRPNPDCDSDPTLYHELYPTFEKLSCIAMGSIS